MGFLVASSKLVFTVTLVVVVLSVAALSLISSSPSTVTYKVGNGDDAVVVGWSTTEPPLMGDSDEYWSSSSKRTFHVGDTIHFEYDPNKVYQHVLQVTPTAYDLCDYTSPLAVFTTGNDSITFNNTGHYYFIFGPGSTCVHGQMLDIYVHEPEEEGNDDVSAVPTLAPAAVSPSSAVLAASPDDDNLYFDYLARLYMILFGSLVIIWCVESDLLPGEVVLLFLPIGFLYLFLS